MSESRTKYQYAAEQLIYTKSCLSEDIRIAEEKLHWSKFYKKGEVIIKNWTTEVSNLKTYLKETEAAINRLS